MLVGCATTTTVCPLGTKLDGARTPEGRVQWCRSSSTLAALPMPGRTYAGVIGFTGAAAMPGGVQGPFTTWYPSGTISSHGHYLDFGARSVPDGLWGFWYPSGQRRTLGLYLRGVPMGCFAVWDEAGTRSTGYVEGEQLRIDGCTPPSDDELLAAEGRAGADQSGPVHGDISAHGFVGSGGIGARNSGQIERDPDLSAVFNLTARARFGRIRVGPTFGVRVSDGIGSYLGLTMGAAIAIGLPRFHHRLDAELGLEVSAQRTSLTAMRPNQPGTAELAFWSPIGAAQLALAFQLTPNLAALLVARVDGAPHHSVESDVSYCIVGGCLPPTRETWDLGGFALGAALGLRLEIE